MGFPIKIEFKVQESINFGELEESADVVDVADVADVMDAVELAGAAGAARATRVAEAAASPEVADASRVLEISPVQLTTGRWSRWIAIAGGFGYVPIAPGTAGSFAGVLVFWLIGAGAAAAGVAEASFVGLYALAVGLLLLLGVRAAGRAEIDFGRRDDGRIVIDEVVGQLITLAPLVPLLWAIEVQPAMSESAFFSIDGVSSTGAESQLAPSDLSIFFFEVVTAFVLFRLFDVWKPGAIRWAERQFGGGLGVMADDVVAGIYAALCLLVLHMLVFERFYSTLTTTQFGVQFGAQFGVSL